MEKNGHMGKLLIAQIRSYGLCLPKLTLHLNALLQHACALLPILYWGHGIYCTIDNFDS